MAKPTSAMCNLDCKYCFYSSKKELYSKEDFKMSDRVLEEYICQYIGANENPEVTFAWQGGEPTLMGIDFFNKAIQLQEKYKKPGMQIFNTIQTNGTLLNDAWCEFFSENNFLVGISIDGPKEFHDFYRKDKNGNNTFKKVIHGLRLMQKHGVDFNILATVNRVNANHPLDVYKFFKDQIKAKYIQFIPIVEVENKDSNEKFKVSDESVQPEQYGKFLSDIFDEWVKHDVGIIFVQIFDSALASWVNYPQSVCLFAPKCGTASIIEHNGDIYSCDHFVDPEHLLGNIMETPLEELILSDEQYLFGQAKKDELPLQCIQCDFKFACHGACPKHRFYNDLNGKTGLNYLCSSYKEFFSHIDWPMRVMAYLFNHGRAPAEIMPIMNGKYNVLKEIFSNINRNDPCPCGSGIKFKKCHGKADKI